VKVASLRRKFFERDPVTCAREFIGCTLGFGRVRGIVVETEAYSALGDLACHTSKRVTARDFVAQHRAGSAYVYLNYGMHWLINFLVKSDAGEGFVLVRALEPLDGLDLMRRRRKQTKTELLCNGPAKLTQALGITGHHHGCDPFTQIDWMITSPTLNTGIEVEVSSRIGISQAIDYPWRFLLKGSRYVSCGPLKKRRPDPLMGSGLLESD